MTAGLRLPRSSQGFFLLSSTFQTHFVQLSKPSQVLVRPTGIQALPSPVNSIIIVTGYGKISHFVTSEINRTEHFAMLP